MKHWEIATLIVRESFKYRLTIFNRSLIRKPVLSDVYRKCSWQGSNIGTLSIVIRKIHMTR